jgi:hypothetical protein
VIHQLMVYADVNFLDEDVTIIKKHIEALSDTCEETGVEVNTEKSKYMLCLVTRLQDRIII